mmetsp:Transcript_20626/g.62951  ORF Transcript_20626/g.62951 Transcript_20626/m.62951 type:complete len:334 (+) Transcript_20626:2482-3483(+)|eukprot:scaffold81103_cov28-Tisochrysis_lutea.AAC.3
MSATATFAPPLRFLFDSPALELALSVLFCCFSAAGDFEAGSGAAGPIEVEASAVLVALSFLPFSLSLLGAAAGVGAGIVLAATRSGARLLTSPPPPLAFAGFSAFCGVACTIAGVDGGAGADAAGGAGGEKASAAVAASAPSMLWPRRRRISDLVAVAWTGAGAGACELGLLAQALPPFATALPLAAPPPANRCEAAMPTPALERPSLRPFPVRVFVTLARATSSSTLMRKWSVVRRTTPATSSTTARRKSESVPNASNTSSIGAKRPKRKVEDGSSRTLGARSRSGARCESERCPRATSSAWTCWMMEARSDEVRPSSTPVASNSLASSEMS